MKMAGLSYFPGIISRTVSPLHTNLGTFKHVNLYSQSNPVSQLMCLGYFVMYPKYPLQVTGFCEHCSTILYRVQQFSIFISSLGCPVGVSISGMSDSLRRHGRQPASLLCPGNSPGKKTGVGSFPPPGDLPSPGVEPRSLALQADFFYCLSHQGRRGCLEERVKAVGRQLVLLHFSRYCTVRFKVGFFNVLFVW